jgi:hypothetical protein
MTVLLPEQGLYWSSVAITIPRTLVSPGSMSAVDCLGGTGGRASVVFTLSLFFSVAAEGRII